MSYAGQFDRQVPMVLLINVFKEYPAEIVNMSESKFIRLMADCVYHTDIAIAKMRSNRM